MARHSAGFTLVELLIVIVISAILAAAAGPSFRDFIIGQRIKTTTFDLFADMTYARSEAIKANAEVVIARANGSWNNGWKVTVVDSGGVSQTLRSRAALDGTMTINGTLDQIKFERNGRPLAGTAAAKFTLDGAGGNASITARCIVVDPGGRPSSTTGACA